MGKQFITDKRALHEFISCEVKRGGLKDQLFPSPVSRFIKALRKLEYHCNNRGLFHKIMSVYYYRKYLTLSLKTGISIPKNTCDKGLTLYHYGSIVVNAACEIGRNCCIMNNVNIGANQGSAKAPKIGNDVYIGPGAVIFGNIEIADGCYVGANAVVGKSVSEPNAVVAGIPAKVLKYDSIHWWEKNRLDRD
jgi:serine O-acetyltransferase